jgi:methylated-DNA-[protein]-cysteine S-methyltransferase
MTSRHITRSLVVDSPVGPLLLVGRDTGLTLVGFQAGRHPVVPDPSWGPDDHQLREAARQLAAYFEGRLRSFDLPLDLAGTPFQLGVWQELQRIPYGHTMSYGEVARLVGNPNASRAVGAAVGRNPLAIIVPCHRVVGSDGSLTGFGGGLPVKEALLALERRYSVPESSRGS